MNTHMKKDLTQLCAPLPEHVNRAGVALQRYGSMTTFQ